jgi:hypothetical protein
VTPSKDREIRVFTNSFSVVFVNAAAGGDQTNFLSRRVVGIDWRGLIWPGPSYLLALFNCHKGSTYDTSCGKEVLVVSEIQFAGRDVQ